MGITESQSKEPNDIKIRKYSPSEFDDLLEKIKFLNEVKANRKFYNDINLNISQLNEFAETYENLEGIKRFSIPIIGPINCGKSTFINSLLPFANILEIGEKVTTKFICIIRHKKDALYPEIYNVKIEKRNENGFNFLEKGENLYKISDGQNNNLSNIIKQKNKEIKDNENLDDYLINPENFFLIIKMKIPLFENELQEYGELIDFLDIPGLDDAKEIYDFDHFIKPIFKNILFPIFIFDIQSYGSDGSKQILKQYIEYYTDIVYENYSAKNIIIDGLFILNKIDLLKENEKEIIYENFKEILKNIQIDSINDSQKVVVNVDENNFIKICENKLCLELDNSNISIIVNELYNELKFGEFNSFRIFIKNYFKKKYNIDIKEIEKTINESSINDNNIKSLNLINKNLKQKCINYKNVELKLNEYIFLSKKFSTKIKENKGVKEIIGKKIKNKIDKLLNLKNELLYEKIHKNSCAQVRINTKNMTMENSNLFINNINELIKKKINPILKNGDKKIKDIAFSLDEFEIYKKEKK